MFGEQEWTYNAFLPNALPDGQISTAGTDVFYSLETTPDAFTFTPLGVRFPVTFETCKLALVSNRVLNGIRTAYICGPPQQLGYLNFIASHEDAPAPEDFRAFAERNLRKEATQVFGLDTATDFCKARAPSGGFASALVCDIQFRHGASAASYRKVFAWSNGVVVSATTACAGVQCGTSLPALDRFVDALSIKSGSNN